MRTIIPNVKCPICLKKNLHIAMVETIREESDDMARITFECEHHRKKVVLEIGTNKGDLFLEFIR